MKDWVNGKVYRGYAENLVKSKNEQQSKEFNLASEANNSIEVYDSTIY